MIQYLYVEYPFILSSVLLVNEWTTIESNYSKKKSRQKHHAQNFICITCFVYHIYIRMMRSENIYLSFFIEYCTSNKANINIDWLGITTIAITFIIDKHINNYVIGWNLSINNWHHPYEILIQITRNIHYEMFLAQ